MEGRTEDWDPTLAPAEGSGRALSESAPHGPGDMPSRIGRYLVLEELGAGGMGVVYAAYDPELDRKVAIKLMYAESDRGRARRNHAMLMREAQALAKLSHPNIVAIHDVGEYAGQVFVAMEFVAGCTLRRWREAAPRGWAEVVAAFVQAGRGLMAAHAVGLVHRDVKPDNLLVGDDGRVRVADFGVARHNAPEDESQVTAQSGTRALATVAGRGTTVGTPAYMAPEQHDNEGVGPHSDQFGFCVALYEALHGLRPFAGETSAGLVAAIRGGVPRRAGTPTRLPPWLERAVLRGLAARPEDRWPSMQALLGELTQDRDARRARWRWRVIYGLMLVLGGVALYLGGRALQASRARGQLEATAAERLTVVSAGIDRLLARGRRADAEEALRAFLAEPEHRGTRAAIDAWLLWAGRMDAAGDGASALAAAVEAYTLLPEGDDREPAIQLRMARLFRAGWRFHELATLAAQAGRRAPATIDDPAWAELRADTALARRDLAGFLGEVDAGRLTGEREATAPVVRALAAARFPAVAEQDILPVPVDVDGDGVDELALVAADGGTEIRRMDAALTLVHRDWPALPIDRGWVNRFSLRRGAGEPGLLIGYVPDGPGGMTTLYQAGPTPRVLLQWEEHRPLSATTADLDGDGRRELYVGTGPYTRQLDRVAPDGAGVWQRTPAHPASVGLGSDFNALTAGDFDGDGREELAVAVGPWRAYDVRVLEAGADGALEVAARWRLGHVQTLTTLRAADGATLLAIAKDNDAPSKQAFPADKPNGEPAGVYIVRREGSTLRPVHFAAALGSEGAAPGSVLWMAGGDLDGDGLEDLVTDHLASERGEFAQLLVWRQLADGSFVPLVLGQMTPLVVGQFDADAADELLVRTRGPDGAMALAIL
ncbi:MAG: protein kinase, partial [Myxococcales bacterium]|nr:protein kinase [Myxococcales bacterium]